MTADANGWLRIAYGLGEHRKIIGLSDAAFRAHIVAMCWAGRNGTDGHLPAAAAGLYAAPKVRAELVAAGLWDTLPDGSYSVHDWGEYQPPADPDDRARWLHAQRQRRYRNRKRDHES